MSYFEYIKRRIRHSGYTRLMLEILAKVGVNLRPFVLLRESIFEVKPRPPGPEFADAETRYLDETDMPAVASLSDLPGRSVTEGELRDRLLAGNKCIGLTLDGELAAFSWCDYEQCAFLGYPFKLKSNEVYLFDAYTLLAFRGKGLGPYIRYRLYENLASQGRDVCYSISDRFNRPSLRFKEKLNARWLVSGTYLVLFSRWRFSFFLKYHERDVPPRDTRHRGA